MADQLVWLGLAIVIIALVSACLYQFGGRANAVEPAAANLAHWRSRSPPHTRNGGRREVRRTALRTATRVQRRGRHQAAAHHGI
jgi:hypothetical protein